MSEWVHSTVGKVTAYQRAGGTPTATTDSFYGGDIPFVTIEDITNGTRFLDRTEKNLSESGLKNSAAWLIKEPHILYSMYATVGKPIINRIACATNQAIIALKESSEIEQSFLFYQLLFMRPDVYKFTSQTTQSNLNASSVKKLPVSYPKDKREQKAIALILTATDIAIEKTEALIAKYQQIKTGLMHDLFTRGVLPSGQLRPPRSEAPELYKETAIGWIPREWDCERLGSILLKSGGYLQTGPFGSQLHADEYQNEGVPVVMPQDINDGLIGTTSIARISPKRAKSLSRHCLKVGDIIIARRGELSRAAAIGDEELNWICGTGCFLLRLGKTELNHFFFSHVYRHDLIQRQVAGLQVGTTMPSLNNNVMSRLFFPFPKVTEQNEMSVRLDAAENEICALQAHAGKLQQKKLGLMQDLLTGKVPVQVNEADAGACM
jgi:type I restriction enzyme S subunit